MAEERTLDRDATSAQRARKRASWPRDGQVLVASVLVHVALAAALLRPRAPSPPAVAKGADAAAEIELDLAPPPHPDLPTGPAVEGSPPERAARDVRPSLRAPHAPSEPVAAAPGSDEPIAEPHDSPLGAPSPASSARPSLGLADLGVGKNPFVPGRSDAATVAPGASSPPSDVPSAKERVEAALRESARAREAELGLGPDGPVRAALAEAMYASDAPVNGMVRFSVVADGRGHVLSVEAISGDRGLSAYRSMESLARKKLASAVLRLPSTAKGARLEVVVTSAWKLPSGHDPGAKISLFGQDLTKGGGKAATQIAVLPLPKVVCVSADDPKNELKLPLCGISAPLVATDGDPADIGAKPRRIVSTKVASSQVL